MRALYPDWRAQGLTACLHEHRGGFAFNQESMLGLADKARAAGAEIVEGVEVTGFERDGSGAVTSVQTSAGDVAVEQVVVAVGPWIAGLWEMLGLPDRLDVHQPDGQVARDQPMWTYWYLQEGEAMFDPAAFVDRRREAVAGPARRLRRAAARRRRHARHRRAVGRLLQARPRDVQGGAVAAHRRPRVRGRPVPDRHRRARLPRPVVRRRSRTASARFEGARERYRQVRSGGVGAFTADNFPVFDYMAPNVYVAADSNHGYKMIAVGQGDRRGARRRALVAAVPVPLRALRDRRPAPGLALALSLDRDVPRRPLILVTAGFPAYEDYMARVLRAPARGRGRAAAAPAVPGGLRRRRSSSRTGS